MKCYYQVLEVETDANDDEIKKSYRRMALKWHPDKNPDNAAEAKEQFQLIQQAYEVLSDPQERAWYDNHKDSILKGGFGSDYKDDSLNVYQYFTSSCYKGFGDDEKGFYAVYAEVFKTISAEDSEFAEDSDSDFEVPVFGDSTSSYEEVVHPFYSYWESYSTKKSYSWLDEFDIRQAPNRRVVRLMEKENKKIRDAARKQRNEEVRALVAFVRKRDKRVQIYCELLEKKALENEQKVKELRQKQILQRKAEMESYVESDWSKFSNLEKELKEIEANLVEEFQDHQSEDEDFVPEDDPLYCIACDKVFKTEKAFTNHENSRKHKENVQNINDMMMEDDKQFGEQEAEESSSGEYDVHSESEDDTPRPKNQNSQPKEDEEDEDVGDASEDEPPANVKKKKKKSKKSCRVVIDDSEQSNEELNTLNDSEDETPLTSSKKKKNKARKPAAPVVQSDHAEIDLEELEANRRSKKGRNKQPDASGSKSKAKKKDKKQPATTATEQDADDFKQIKSEEPAKLEEISCAACKEVFKSKNALFKHLKSTGHQIPLPTDKKPDVSKKKAKSSKKNT